MRRWKEKEKEFEEKQIKGIKKLHKTGKSKDDYPKMPTNILLKFINP